MIKYEPVNISSKYSLNTLENPLYLYIELNNMCNLKCKFCSIENKNNQFISFEKVKYILDEMINNGIYDVYYTGGEPFLHPQISQIIRYTNKLGIRQTILTNGTLLDNYVDELKYVTCIAVSLHGEKNIYNKLTNSNMYNKVINNIKLIRNKTIVQINCTITSENQNIENMISVLKFANKENIPITFTKYNNIGEGKKNQCFVDIKELMENFRILKEQNYDFKINNCIAPCSVDEKYLYMTHGCGAGYIFGSINYEGDVKICPSSNQKIGNIFSKKLKSIWNSKDMRNFRSLKWLPEYCKSCKEIGRCRGACKAELGNRINEFNDLTVKNVKNKKWENIRNKKMKVNISLLRKEKKDYISLSTPPRKYNKLAVNILRMINDGIEIEKLYEYKNFIVALYEDRIIEEDKNAKKNN